MKKIILDTDPGIDDAQAIAYALAHPDIELLGLTTVFGNASIETTTRNALLLVERFVRHDIPVARGAAVPLVQAPLPHADFVHGADGIGNLNLAGPQKTEVAQSAAEFIVAEATRHAGELTLVAVGPLTNIAAAVALDPSLPQKVRELVVMGGALDEPGNVSPVAEANFLNDPHAADQVLAHDWPMTVIGLDVTHKILLTDSHLARLRDNARETGQFLWDSSRFYVDFYSKKGAAVGHTERSCAMHDATAVVYLNQPAAFTLESGPSRVVNEGIAVGQFTMDRKGYQYSMDHWANRPVASCAMQVDANAVRNDFLDSLTQYAPR